MLRFISIMLSCVAFALAGMKSISDAGAFRRPAWESKSPLQTAQSPSKMEVAMDKADAHSIKGAASSQEEAVIVGDIRLGTEKSGAEKVCFSLNRFCDPQVFSIEKGTPRIVIDIKNVISWSGKPRIPVNGVLIMQVRTHLHRDYNKLRIVLDLTPSIDYTAEPIYYEAEGIYCIAVAAK